MKDKECLPVDFNFLSKFSIISALSFIVSGCATNNMDYRVNCDPRLPRNYCVDSGYKDYECSREQQLITMCAGFVNREVVSLKRSEVHPENEIENRRVEYDLRFVKPVFVGASKGGPYVWVRGDKESQYVSTASLVPGVVDDAVNNYDMAVHRYFESFRGKVSQDQSEVYETIKRIENLSVMLSRAIELGSPFLNKLPQVGVGRDYESLALQVVNRVNPSDIYLKKAAELAIAEQKEKESLSRRGSASDGEVEAAINDLRALKARLDMDYKEKFFSADLKMKEEMSLAESQRLRGERNRLSRDNNKAALERNDSEKSMACKMSPELCN